MAKDYYTENTDIDSRIPLLAETACEDKRKWGDWKAFFWLFWNGLPVIGTILLKQSLTIATVITLGHLGPAELAAATLANMLAGITGLVIAFGALNALETVCSQAWTGSETKQDVGLYLQKACVMFGIILVPISLVWWNAKYVLLALGQSDTLAELAGQYLRCFLPGFIGYGLFEALRRFLQAQGIMSASTYVMLIVAPANFALHYVLVFCEPFKLGFIGGPIALTITFWLSFLLILAYTCFIKGHEGWGGWSRLCLQDWWPLWRLVIPCIFATFLEFCIIELSVLAAAMLSSTQLASQSILVRTFVASRAVGLGLSSAAASRIGNVLGDGLVFEAQRTFYMGCLLALSIGGLQTVVFLATRHEFALLFTNDPSIIQQVTQVLPVFALFQMVDALGGHCAGVLRGMGRQRITAVVIIFAYYMIGFPLSFMLTFWAELSLVGLWIGLAAAFCLATALQLVYLLRIDWQKEGANIQNSRLPKSNDYKYLLDLDEDALSSSSSSTIVVVPARDRWVEDDEA